MNYQDIFIIFASMKRRYDIMKTSLSSSLAILLCIICCTSCRSDLEIQLRELDEAIEKRQEAEDSISRLAGQLRIILGKSSTNQQKWDNSFALFNLYKSFQADSAMLYLDRMGQLCDGDPAKDFEWRYNSAMTLATRRAYSMARETLDGIKLDSLSEVDYARYYKAQLYIYGMMSADEMIPQDRKEELLRLRNEMRLIYIACPGIEPMEKVRRNAMQRYQNGHAMETIPVLEALLNNTQDSQDRLDVAYSIAEAYEYAGNREMRKWWMAKNATNAIKCGNKTTMSLYELCNLLFEDNELARASRYCKVAVDNAMTSGYTAFILNSAYSQLTIATAVEATEKRAGRRDAVVIVILSLLICVAAWLMRQSYRQRATILRINGELEDAGRVKEGYLYKYMGMAVRYLDSVEGLRRSVRKAMKEGNTEAINTLLRDPRYNREEYTRFYEEFDKTFLGIYPDFPDKVNALLPPQEHFKLRKNNEMPTGLRILAAIRLGFTDSGSIAEFLSCAPSSVYTHRSRIKKAALCPTDRFEEIVRSI